MVCPYIGIKSGIFKSGPAPEVSIKDPHSVVKAGQIVKVKVLEVDENANASR